MNLFETFLFEAPDDNPPDVQPEQTPSGPPDVPDEAPPTDPPDIPDDAGTQEPVSDDPPDMPSDDEFGGGTGFGDEDLGGGEGSAEQDLGLDEKISAIMNMNLYQRFLSMLNTIGGQLTMLKDNGDVLYTLSPDSLDTVNSLKKLEENIRLYLKNSFLNENYSKNILFFNKCLNLLKLLNDVFDKNIRKGINAMK